mgnify:CR=1 FL=1
MQIDRECPDCHETGIFTFGELIQDSRLSWQASHVCLMCGFVVEIDDYGMLPDHLRNIVLEQEGIFELKFNDSLRLRVLKIMRDCFKWTMQDTKDFMSLKSNVLEGTHIEMRLIQDKLTARSDNPIHIHISKKSK